MTASRIEGASCRLPPAGAPAARSTGAIRSRRLRQPAAPAMLAAALVAGCGPGSRDSGPAVTVDSTADTIVVRIAGAAPELRLVEELRIAPAADDTTLFTEVGDFKADPLGRVWVHDRPTHTLLVFSPGGTLLRRIGRQGGGPGEFNDVSGMALLGDTGLAVWDPRNGRVSILDSAGAYRAGWRTPVDFVTNDGLVSDRQGALYLRRPVAEPVAGQVIGAMGLVRLGPEGLRDSLPAPELPVARIEYLAERKSKEGTSRSLTSAAFTPRSFWGWHPAGGFVAADGGRYRIVVAGAAAGGTKPRVIERSLPAVEVSPAEREEERAWITWSLRRTDPGWSWNGPALPDRKAPLTGLVLTRDGRIWAEVAVQSEPIPEAEGDLPRDPKQPVRRFRTPEAYEIFEATGRLLGRVAFPPRSRLMDADGRAVWALVRDQDGLPAVVRFRLERER